MCVSFSLIKNHLSTAVIKRKGQVIIMNFTIIFLIILTLVSRLIGMGREMTLAYFYGATNVSDAYLMSIAVPTILVTFVVVALATSYIPSYQKHQGSEAEKNAFTNKVIGLTLIACFIIIILTLAFTPFIVRLFVSGFDDATVNLTATFIRLSVFAVFFMGLNHVLHSFMQVKEKVLLASLSGLPFNVMAITFIVLSHLFHLHLLAIGTVFAIGAQTIYLLILAKRQQFTFKPQFSLKDAEMKQLMILTAPIILANTVDQIGMIVDKNMASTFGPGAVSAFTYAARTVTATSGVFLTSIIVVTFPKISKLATKNDIVAMKDSLAESFVGLSLFIIPLIAAVAVFSHSVITVLFGRGAFDAVAISTTSDLLYFNIFFLLGNGFTQLITRVFFALKDTKTPMIFSTLTIILNILLNIVFTRWFGISGLALATSVAAFVGMLALLFMLRRKIGSLRLRRTLVSIGKIIGATGMMIGGAYVTYYHVSPFSSPISLVLAAIVGTGIYGIFLLFLRIKEVDKLIALVAEAIRKHIKNKRNEG